MIEAFSTGFYNALKANSALQTKLGGSASDYKIYNTRAPEGSAMPYVTFGMLTNVPEGTFDDLGAMEDFTFWINVFSSTGLEHISEIVDLVKTAMDDVSLTITGYTALYCMREFVGNPIFNADTKIYQIPMRYRVIGSK